MKNTRVLPETRKFVLKLTFRIVVLLLSALGLEIHAGIQTDNWKENKEVENQVIQLYQAARYHEAIPLAKNALEITEKTFGPKHPNTAASLSNLAAGYQAIGQYDKAEPLYQRALAILETILGPEHPGTATSVNNLGALYRAGGQYDQALPLYQRALAIREKVLGPEHPNTASSVNNLGAQIGRAHV